MSKTVTAPMLNSFRVQTLTARQSLLAYSLLTFRQRRVTRVEFRSINFYSCQEFLHEVHPKEMQEVLESRVESIR